MRSKMNPRFSGMLAEKIRPQSVAETVTKRLEAHGITNEVDFITWDIRDLVGIAIPLEKKDIVGLKYAVGNELRMLVEKNTDSDAFKAMTEKIKALEKENQKLIKDREDLRKTLKDLKYLDSLAEDMKKGSLEKKPWIEKRDKVSKWLSERSLEYRARKTLKKYRWHMAFAILATTIMAILVYFF